MAGSFDVRDVVAWRLAHQLNLRVDLFLLSPDFRRHYAFCDPLCDAARAAPDHIAEGLARVPFKERVRLLRIAKVHKAAVLQHLMNARHQGLITDDEYVLTQHVARQAIRAADRLIRSIEPSSEARVPAAWK